MNSDNASNEIAHLPVDLVNMAKELMDENQQPSGTKELGRLFPSTRGGERRGESRELFSVGAGESSASATHENNTSFATRSTTKRTIEEIWGSRATSKKPLNSMSLKTTLGKTPSRFAILFHVKCNDSRFLTSFHFSSLIFRERSLKFSKQKVSYFEPFQSRPKEI